MNYTRKISVKELANLLGVHYNTARKDYKILVDCINSGRTFLIYQDLIILQLIDKNQQNLPIFNKK